MKRGSLILDLKAERLFPWAFDLNCDQIHFQMASHEFAEVDPVRGWPANKDLGLFQAIPPEQVSVSTDCGIASMRRNVAKTKLGAIVAGRDLVSSQPTGD
ncbi:hypothetical protein [Pseudonocardia sp. GCM10023141]|uniref:hypothetical protein n=1 Tax=Pseudonocardia sp. GCM10023141 TaxID=3252653 RepID=UPI00361FE17D